MGRLAKDLLGQQFGHVTVIGRAPKRPNNSRAFWRCQCECGNIFEAATSTLERLKLPEQYSCGCIKKNVKQQLGLRGKDLKGKRFGWLTVLDRDYEYSTIQGLKKQEIFWKCQCDCGNITYVRSYNLTHGQVSCGCFKSTCDNLTNKKFGEVLVLGPDFEMTKNNKGCYWKCQCSCGNIFSATSNQLLKVWKNPRCPDCMKIYGDNLVGQTFNYLTVIAKDLEYKKDNNIETGSYWKCKCICGNETTVRADCLRKGTIKSCGCKRLELNREKQVINEVGNKYGTLLVLEEDIKYVSEHKIKNSGNVAYWKCQCDCGNICTKPGTELRANRNITCPECVIRSKGEEQIKSLLIENNISFIHDREYFKDLVGDNNILRYDFILLQNNKPYRLIEYDGEQHFKPIDYFGGEERFKLQQKYDQIKNEYAKTHNLPLVRIPYTVKQITIEMLLGTTEDGYVEEKFKYHGK